MRTVRSLTIHDQPFIKVSVRFWKLLGSLWKLSRSFQGHSRTFHESCGTFHEPNGSFHEGCGSFQEGCGSFHETSVHQTHRVFVIQKFRGSFVEVSINFRKVSEDFRKVSRSFRKVSGSFQTRSSSFQTWGASFWVRSVQGCPGRTVQPKPEVMAEAENFHQECVVMLEAWTARAPSKSYQSALKRK